MGYEPVDIGAFGYKGNPLLDSYDASREAERKRDADRWTQIQGQGRLDLERQQLEQQGSHQKFEEGRQTTADQDAIVKQATELTQAGMPLQAQQLLAMHGYNPMAVAPQPPGGTGVPGQEAPKPTSAQPGNDLQGMEQESPSPEPSDQEVANHTSGIPRLQLPTPPALMSPDERVALSNDLRQNHSLEGHTEAHPDKSRLTASRDMEAYQAADQYGSAGQNAIDMGAMGDADRRQAIAAHGAQQVQTPQAGQASQVDMRRMPASKILSYRGPGGQSLQIDPMEARRAQQEQNAYRAQQYMAAMRGTPLEASAGSFSGLLAAGEDIKPSDVMGLQRAEAAARLKAEEDKAKVIEQMRHSPDVATQDRWQHERNLAIMAGHGGGGSGIPGKAELDEAKDIGSEIDKHYGELIGPKGVAVLQNHLAEQISNAKAGNPVDMTNLVDALIRTNTGRAAIKKQYDLYVQHAGGTADQIDKWLETAKSGGLGSGITGNLIGSAESALAELERQGGEANKKFHDTYDQDPRVQHNPEAQHKVKAMERGIFGGMHGYGAPPAAPTGPGPANGVPSDAEAVKMAQERYAKNPNDAVAKRVLQMHGLLK